MTVVATTLNSRALLELDRPGEAAAALRNAIEIARAALVHDHQLVAIYTLNAAAVELARKQPASAEKLVREGLRIRALAPGIVPVRRRTFLQDDWSIGATKSLLGAALVPLERYDEAEAMLLEARQDLDASAARRGSEVKTTISRLVDLYVAWGKPEAAAYRALLAS